VNLADAPSRKRCLATQSGRTLADYLPRSVGQLPDFYDHFPSKKDSYIEGDSSPCSSSDMD